MAGTANAIDFAWFRYTDNAGGHWSVKVDKDWGALTASGLATFNAADPPYPSGGKWRARKCLLQDTVSSRKTTRICGTTTATALTPGTSIVTVARGQTGSYTLTSLGEIPERKPKAGTIISKPEPITT